MARTVRRYGVFVVLSVVAVYILLSYLPIVGYGPSLFFGDQSRNSRGGIPIQDAFRKWRLTKTHFPVKRYIRLPGAFEAHIPRIQHDFRKFRESEMRKEERHKRRKAIQEAFEHSWNGYEKYAWLHDEIAPMSGGHRDPFGAWGATLVDSLDTLWIMGMEKEFEMATNELRKIDFTQCDMDVINLFETVIRYIGGMLGAYDLSGKKYNVLLHKAIELGEMLYHAFDTPNHMPLTRWNWTVAAYGEEMQQASTDVIVAELGSMTLEFTRLTQLTGDKKYYDAVQRIMNLFQAEQNQTKIPGLWPLRVDAQNMNLHEGEAFTLGGQADSLYEYLPKQYLLLGGRDEALKDMYENALEAAKTYLAFEPMIPLQSEDSGPPSDQSRPPTKQEALGDPDASPKLKAKRDYDFSPDYSNPILLGTATSQSATSSVHLTPLAQHLSCYAGGMVALAARAFSPYYLHEITDENLDLAERLVAGCVWSYKATPSKIGPELFVAAPCRRGRAAITSGEERDWTGVEPGKCRWDREKWEKAVRTHFTASRDPAQLALEESSDPDYWENEIRRMGLREGFVEVVDSSYKLRPEAVESLFVLYRITGDPKYQDIAWDMWEAIDQVARTKYAYAGVADVMVPPVLSKRDEDVDEAEKLEAKLTKRDAKPETEDGQEVKKNFPQAKGKAKEQRRKSGKPSGPALMEKRRKTHKPSGPPLMDNMESFWTAETLKYFYLIFAEPSLVSLDEYVFNTEAHPFRWRDGPPKPGENHG
ncbi:MAG: hypothetical protein Q9162_000014 [Coniocarpon cinnabarinum]